ncbi:hypothetical protein HWA77_09075 [Photobacterium damselae subsp. damselae]|uniref:Uncharacterized protein n=1 Tax=Photobacterium damselae subsp. damselae TaxID=85581 RepID=A0A850QVE4_PHODD|nr:hypothetical protein [Photobacterium damselae subsp. damselae]
MSKKPLDGMDIPSMSALLDDEYRNLIDGDLVFVDHHEILRIGASGQPLATSIEQLNILIEELNKMKVRMLSRDH